MTFEEWNPNGAITSCPKFSELPVADKEYEELEALNWSTLSRFLKEPAYKALNTLLNVLLVNE